MTVDYTCPDCGFDFRSTSPRDCSGTIRSLPRRYRAVLTRTLGQEEDVEEIVRRRPADGVWSALEYTAHAAQMIDMSAPNLRQIITEDHPHLYQFDPDQQAEEQDYNDWTILQAIGELESACADLSMAIEYVPSDQWNRVGEFDAGLRGPDAVAGEKEAIDVARNAVHEGVHHLRDIRRGLTQILGREIDEPF